MRRSILLNLDIGKNPNFNREFSVKNGDSLFLTVNVSQNNQPLVLNNQVVRVYIRKSDGGLLLQKDDIEITSPSQFVVKLKNTATNVSGLCYMEFEFQDEEEASVVVATAPVLFEVEDRVGDVSSAITAVNDIYILGEVEKFIAQAKEDIALLKQQIAQGLIKIEELHGLVDTKTDELNTRAEEIFTDLEKRELGVIKNITKLVGDKVVEIENTTNQSIETIETTTSEKISEIETTTSEKISEIETTGDEKISEIETTGDETIEAINTAGSGKVEEIETATNEAIEAIGAEKTTSINEIQAETAKGKKEISDSVTQERNGIIQLSLREQDKILAKTEKGVAEIEGTTNLCKEELNTIITNADELKTSLLSSIANAETQKQGLDSSITEAGEKITEVQTAITAIDELKALCEKLKADLEAENTEANENINELKTLNPAADIRIEELRRLIEEAKKYEVVVANWIANREPAQDLTEVNKQLEELYQAVEMLDAKFSDYYTKEEVDEIVEELKANSGGGEIGFIGSIGTGVKVASMPAGIFDNMPEPSDLGEGVEYIGKWLYSEPAIMNGTDYVVCYLYNNKNTNTYPYIYVDDSSTDDTMFRTKDLGGPLKTMVAYKKSGSSWASLGSIATFYPQRKVYNIYHCDIPVYTDINKTGIYQEATTGAFISNLDLANKQGNYSFTISKNDYKELQNAPKVSLENDIDTVLKCYKKDNTVYQEVVIEGVVYTRKIGDVWTCQNTSNFIKKETVAEIKAGEGSVSLPEFYNTCPVPNTSAKVVGEIDFKADANKYYRIYAFKDKGNEMFYKYISSPNCSIGFTASNGNYYVAKYVYQNNAWSLENNQYNYGQGKASEIVIYRNTLPVCNATSTSKYDKNTIIKEIDNGDSKPTINDFNLATTYGVYNIDVKERETVLNTPVEGALKGILECVVAEGNITQKVSADNGDIYTRYFNGSEWTEWEANVKRSEIENLLMTAPDKLQTFDYTNADGMIENYNWIDLNGLKVMIINVKHSEAEYNSGVNGAMMKTLNFPPEAQIFNTIFSANINSYCRESNVTLSRVVQNVEIISNNSVRGRWRHTDDTRPYIDRFTITCIGF